VGVQIAMQVREYLKSGVAQNAVNLPSLTHEEFTELAPYMTLAERLGTFLAQFPKGTIESIGLKYRGRIAELKTDLVRNAALAGVLGHLEPVNRINAASIAAERGIRIHEEKKEAAAGGAGSVLQLTLHTTGGSGSAEIAASGALLHGEQPRLLRLDGIDIEAPLQGTLLAIRNRDVPGVIGRIGTILGAHAINIANFALGRAGEPAGGGSGATALAVLQIDGEAPEAVLAELRAEAAITGVRQVTL
jgi:D-3-phosphoglycerate dehydrogenase